MAKLKYFIIFILAIVLALLTGCTRNFKDAVSPPIDTSAIPPTPIDLSAEIGDGFIALAWSISDTSLVSQYQIYKADSVGEEYTIIGNSLIESFTANNLQNGQLYFFKVSSLNADGFEGYSSDPIFAVPELFAIQINNGNEYTSQLNVTLNLTAPADVRLMQVSSDSSFSGSQWEAYFAARAFQLDNGDGIKTVYCRFRDFSDRTTWGYFSDSIILDTEAFIDSVVFSPSGPFSPGESIHFSVYASEPDGSASITIGNSITNVDLFDNGSRGDAVADDGIYEFDFTIPLSFDFEDQIIYGDFADRAGNTAAIIEAANLLSIRRAPNGVNIFGVTAPHGSFDILELEWEQSEASDFAQYRIYRGNIAGVDSTDFLVASISSIGETAVADTGLSENMTYYYKVYVVDITGLWGGSNEVSASTGQNTVPDPVVLYPIIVEPDHYQEINIEWSEANINDFESYRLYRWQESVGRDDSVIVAFITDRNSTTFTDQPPFNPPGVDTVSFWYILHVYDNTGNNAGSDSVLARLIDAAPPQVTGSVSASDSSLIITWSQSEIPDFGSYRLLRDIDSNPVGAVTVFVTADQLTVTYDDEATTEGQTYYYWLDIYDLRDNSSQSVLGSGAW